MGVIEEIINCTCYAKGAVVAILAVGDRSTEEARVSG
jgi:hypothetical protein